jgi:hypothetical protein
MVNCKVNIFFLMNWHFFKIMAGYTMVGHVSGAHGGYDELQVNICFFDELQINIFF